MATYKSDRIIIGAGLYGLYAALFCARWKEKVIVLECDSEAFGRATYINQARVHQGYHYPRSLSTAEKSAGYFARFNHDFAFCIYNMLHQAIFLGRMAGNFRIFAVQLIYLARKYLLVVILKQICVMGHFWRGNIHTMQKFSGIIIWKSCRIILTWCR